MIMLATTGPREVAKRIPLGRLLLETDAPYFKPKGSPRPLKFSNPTNAKLVAYEVARIRKIPKEDVLKLCLENTRRI